MKNFKSDVTRYALIILSILISTPADAHAQERLVLSGLQQISKKQDAQGLQTRSRLTRADHQSILNWYLYKEGSAQVSFEEVAGFINAHPDWPSLKRIQSNAERNLNSVSDGAMLMRFFAQHEPETLTGAELYVQTLLKSGQASQARTFINTWWGEASLSRDGQRQFFAAFKNYINRDAHIKRLHMVMDEGDFENAQAIVALLGREYQALFQARRALKTSLGNIDGLVQNVPAQLKNDPGLLLERIRWRRQKDLNQGAIDLLQKAPTFEQMRRPKSWWRERHIMIRRLMEDKNYRQAYALARAHRQKEGFPKAQAEWVSGFLALTFLDKNWEAFEHFEKLYHSVESPISIARGAYWAGVASERLGHADIAKLWFDKAVQHPETFYGQMAAAEINTPLSFDFKSEAQGTQSTLNRQLAEAARLYQQAGLKEEAALFLRHAANTSKSAAEYHHIAKAAHQMRMDHVSIHAAQKAGRAGYNLDVYAYPDRSRDVRGISDVEWSLIHGLIRQESRFDQYAISHAGARGLMQLMPATAKQTARQIGISHQRSWLTSRPAHNLQLGSRYIKQMIDRYNGSYAMALAAYNAGPGRVDRWIEIYGDPRHSDVDLITWIESIPIYETRNYVQRVLEATYVYRYKFKSIQKTPEYPLHIAMR